MRDEWPRRTDLSPEREAAAVGTTSANWIDPPYNRVGYLHVRELTRTASVARGHGPVWSIPGRAALLHGLPVSLPGGEVRLGEVLTSCFVDSMVVVHDGAVVVEYHDTGVDPSTNHLLMSVSKSVAALLTGILVERGVIGTDTVVESVVPELLGTAWEGCSVQHLLDMRAGVRFDEHDMDDPGCHGRVIEWVSGYTFPTPPELSATLPTNTRDWIVSLEKVAEHGSRYEYQSICTDVLAWMIERSTGRRYSDVLSDELWSRLGAVHDADLIVDATGFPVAEGGLCATAGDLARLGQMVLDGGVARGEQVVPEAWIERILTGPDELVAQFAAGHDAIPSRPSAYYHDGWWVTDPARGEFRGLGLGGQQLFIDREAQLVVVILSSTPLRIDPTAARTMDAALKALRDTLR